MHILLAYRYFTFPQGPEHDNFDAAAAHIALAEGFRMTPLLFPVFTL